MTELEALYDSWQKGLIPLDTILENQKSKVETIAKKIRKGIKVPETHKL